MPKTPPKRPLRARRRQGEGTVFQRRNGLWVGRIEAGWTPEGRRRRIVVTSMDHSVMMTKMAKAKTELATYGYTADPSATLTQWIEKWLPEVASKTVRGKTYAGYASILRKWVEPTIGKRKLAALTPDDWRAVRDAMANADPPRSTTTARQAYYALRSCLETARREGLITSNVLDRIKAPAAAVNGRGSFTPLQARAILNVAGSRHIAALLTAARQSELLGLCWSHVDLDGPTPQIRIEWQMQELRERHGCGARGADARYPCGFKQAARCPTRSWQIPEGHDFQVCEGRLAWVRPKSKHGVRVVPLLPELVTVLRRHREQHPPGPHDLVWHVDGHPIPHKVDEAEWRATMRQVGLPESCTLHWARHSCATLLMSAGVATEVIQEICGHGTVAVTSGYIHVSSALAQQGMAKLGELLA